MKAYVLSLTLIASVTAFGQPYTLPGTVFDKMAFEVSRGRVCDTLQRFQFKEITKLQTKILADATVTKELEAKCVVLDSLRASANKELKASEVLWGAEKESLQDKIKGLWKWVAGLGALDVALLLILLL